MKKYSILTLILMPLLLALSAGDPAPKFEAKNQNGKTVQSSDFKGKFLLIFFYPKDFTSGCTKEACSFRDEYSAFKKMDIEILGVSRQNAESHQKFKAQHRLPFDLLVDENGSLSKTFGVGTYPIIGLTERQSILISKEGRVIRFYKKVDPDTHAKEVLQDVKNAGG